MLGDFGVSKYEEKIKLLIKLNPYSIFTKCLMCCVSKPGVDFIGAKNWRESPQKSIYTCCQQKTLTIYERMLQSVQENKNRKIDLSVIHVYTERI